ncbi:nuclear transport factor 2 family protein [Rhizobium sp. P38BS-XIX]|uniref:nuclear transport factor 2 family protein n=1 Tax=Rhizobium sp. P38BS-XIX TaxID=2726740 RepID=UPI00145643DA|nr:nuclear transport factor 2 family protein [Rhizobium sp. P38BS-XIX]NLS00400.1 nuclear transport factor 2 family protein [Rhizobium sp. P38BS-XIX]
MQQAIQDLFQQYERQTNAALAGKADIVALLELYDDVFIGSSPTGVMTGKKDQEFQKALTAGFARNCQIGARRMEIEAMRIEPIDTIHAVVHVDWRARYELDDALRTIDFSNAYLTRVVDGKARVFGWITGDEEAELHKHGVI